MSYLLLVVHHIGYDLILLYVGSLEAFLSHLRIFLLVLVEDSWDFFQQFFSFLAIATGLVSDFNEKCPYS
jgi:hypothetical protein